VVNINDALEVLKHLAKLESVIRVQGVTINDALDILKHLAKMPSTMRTY
jgi:hypothetical protein